MMKKILLGLFLALAPITAIAADLSVTPGTGATIRCPSVESGDIACVNITLRPTAPSANFTRPANTTTYASGQLVANSTTAGSVVPLSWTVNTFNAAPVYIRRAIIEVNSNGVTSPSFRLHLYTSSPTPTNGDGATYLTTVSGHFCDMDVNMPTTTILSSANDGIGVPNFGGECLAVPSAQLVYGLIEARGAYVPTSGEVFTVTLEVYQP